MSKIYIYIIIIFLCIVIIKSDQPEDYKCTTIDQLKVGEEVVLCVHVLEHNKKKKRKVAIKIKTDEYSVVSFEGIHDIYHKNFNDIELLAQIGNVTSVFTSVSCKK